MNKYYSFPGGTIIDNNREWNWVYYFKSGGRLAELSTTHKYREGFPRVSSKEVAKTIGRKKLKEIINYIRCGKHSCSLY